MPVIVVFSGGAIRPRSGHLGARQPQCESHVAAGRFSDTAARVPSADNVDFGLDQNAIVIESEGPDRQARCRRTEVGAVSALSQPRPATHNNFDREQGCLSPHFLAVKGRVTGCPRRFTTCLRSGRGALSSTRPNTSRCTPALSAIPTGSGPNRPSASTGSSLS